MIDGGPLRTSRPTGRQIAYRNESVRHHREEPQPMEPAMPVERPRQYHRQAEPEHKERVERAPRRSYTKLIASIALVIAIITLVGAGWFVLSGKQSVASAIATDKYQAVFLSNGQVYFGKLTIVNGDYMKLTNVFYLEKQLTATSSDDKEKSDSDTNPTSGDNNFQLLKYSDVLYGSEDAMILSKKDVIRFENLRTDGVVAKAIANRR